jgi:hypothetical protein
MLFGSLCGACSDAQMNLMGIFIQLCQSASGAELLNGEEQT